jgi:hypothetical protein
VGKNPANGYAHSSGSVVTMRLRDAKSRIPRSKRMAEPGASDVDLCALRLWRFAKMPIKPLPVMERDLARARQIARSWAPLGHLSPADAEIVARAIAEGIAEGRKYGLEIGQACAASGHS